MKKWLIILILTLSCSNTFEPDTKSYTNQNTIPKQCSLYLYQNVHLIGPWGIVINKYFYKSMEYRIILNVYDTTNNIIQNGFYISNSRGEVIMKKENFKIIDTIFYFPNTNNVEYYDIVIYHKPYTKIRYELKIYSCNIPIEYIL